MKFEICGFESLHRHSDRSTLDGWSPIIEYAEMAQEVNQMSLCISDHGVASGLPEQLRMASKFGLFPIFAIELYVNNEQPKCRYKSEYSEHVKHLDEKQKLKLKKSHHLLAIAFNDVGYRNLVALTSWSHIYGYGGLPRRPRVTHEILKQHREGIIFTSCCCISEIANTLDQYGKDAAYDMLKKYYEMFGENFYLELMLLDFKRQKPYDTFLVEAHNKLHIPIFISCDTHYARKSDAKFQKYLLMTRTKNTLKSLEQAMASGADATEFFEIQDQNLWNKSEPELNEKWFSDYQEIIPYDIFKLAKRTSVEIANKAKGVQIDRTSKLPQIEDADEKLKESLAQGFKRRNLSGDRYTKQLKKEYELICRKGFASYFYIEYMMVNEAKRYAEEELHLEPNSALGPGRGCLSGTTPIITIDSTKPISEITTKDIVLNKNGIFVPVLETYTYDCHETLIHLKVFYGDQKGITLTKDHKLYCICKEPQDNLDWRRADKIQIGDWLYFPKPIVDEPTKNLSIYFKTRKMQSQFKWIGLEHGILLQVKEVSKVYNPSGKVYDLKVDGDEPSYCTTSCLVHNSAGSFLTCYCLGITDVDPIRHDLVPEAFLSDARGGRQIKLKFTTNPIEQELLESEDV